MGRRLRTALVAVLAALLAVPLAAVVTRSVAHAAGPQGQVTASVIGQIDRLFLDDPNDPFSGGIMVVAGQLVTLPRNLLYDLPANRLSLSGLFAQAPAECVALKESGLAKADNCNHSGSGAVATVEANRTSGGNVIAGDVFLQKGVDTLSGKITFIDYDQGFYRVNGTINDPTTGVMVRLDDPSGKHTAQLGAGCTDGSPNCSADVRFGLDPDNYTNKFSTGYPLCIPSTQARPFTDSLGVAGPTGGQAVAQADAAGNGDALCPATNRSAPVDPALGQVSQDSRRFAPVRVGDSVSATGNFETIGGVHFLSAHTSTVSLALTTNTADPSQPDYVILNEAFVDAPGFFRERSRDLFIGATTAVDSDVVIWTIHRDPGTNAAHEFPLGTVVGCENAAGALQCRRVLGPNTFRVRHDVDFVAGAGPALNPCQQLNADPRFAGRGICPDGNNSIADMFGLMSPIPHEVQLRTGREIADLASGAPRLHAIDVQGRDAAHGQYLFPFGVGLGGIELPFFAEINPNLLDNPASFSGLPWALDRRLSPGGCPAQGCEATPQPLDPFPFEGFDPRQPGTSTPQGRYADPTYTASPLSNERNRILSYVDPAIGNFNGDATVLAWPPADPPAIPIQPTPPNGTNTAPTARADAATVATGSAANNIDVLANDLPGATPFDPATVAVGTAPAHGTATANPASGVVDYVPGAGFTGTDTFTYTVRNTGGLASNPATVTVTVAPPPAPAPTLTGFSPASGVVGSPVTVTGSNLDAVTAVGFGAVSAPAASFTAVSPTSITVPVPAGASGAAPLTVTSSGGTATSATDFTATPAPPTVTGFSPASGVVGDTVTITGTNLAGTTGVAFNGVDQPVVNNISPTQITAAVPVGAATGPATIVVTTAGGSATAPAQFTVNPPPATLHQITAVTPNSGPAGTLVQVDGMGFGGLSGVAFNGVATGFSTATNSTFFTTVPNGATTGRITVTLGGGGGATTVITSPADFTVTTTGGGTPTAPSAPTIGTATPLNGGASVTWQAPAATGGSALTGYTVQAVRSDGAVAGTAQAAAGATSATVTGLTNGMAYRLRVQAVNAAGSGPFSALSTSVTPAKVPAAPAIGTASAGVATDQVISATGRWTAPANTGGSPVTGYMVTAVQSGGTRTAVLVGATARSVTITGLLAGRNYRFQVQAINAVGVGPASRLSNAVKAQ